MVGGLSGKSAIPFGFRFGAESFILRWPCKISLFNFFLIIYNIKCDNRLWENTMTNLRDVQSRMRAIRQTLKVTKAMNLISAAKLRKGRKILEDTEPFFKRIQKVMYDILSGTKAIPSEYLLKSPTPASYHSAVVVVTSDKGLVGGYNANIHHTVTELCATLKNPVLIIVGSIGNRYFSHDDYPILETFSFRSKLPDMDGTKEITDFITSHYTWGAFDEVHIVYTHMYNAVKIQPNILQLLPLNAGKIRKEIEPTSTPGTESKEELQFKYLPSEQVVFDSIVPFYIKGILYSSLVEAYVSEQNARMLAMTDASKNAEEMLSSLQIHFNRVRQASITGEVTEIVSGFATLSE